jgi:hypothetical protein
MPKCPKCKAVIDFLTCEAETRHFYTVSLEGTSLRFDEDDSEVVNEVYTCPECGEELFYDENDAKDFLYQDYVYGDESEA